MTRNFSCGAVLYKVESEKILFLLVFSKRNLHWGFPKGHIEKGETEIETAKREVFEETGISEIEFDEVFRYEEIYEILSNSGNSDRKKVEKHSIYFLAKVLKDAEGKTFHNNNEIEKTEWLPFDEAIDRLKFDENKNLLRTVWEKLGGR
ncbi:MAG: NUDIX domain-containing protein [Elusimicrobiota bacterium]|jgi:8-oxo-dGTP pyrophosphatase MutT (NUDIX family)|nr:NUDIX domain-containing protein [Elusimicrobiota bacterium]